MDVDVQGVEVVFAPFSQLPQTWPIFRRQFHQRITSSCPSSPSSTWTAPGAFAPPRGASLGHDGRRRRRPGRRASQPSGGGFRIPKLAPRLPAPDASAAPPPRSTPASDRPRRRARHLAPPRVPAAARHAPAPPRAQAPPPPRLRPERPARGPAQVRVRGARRRASAVRGPRQVPRGGRPRRRVRPLGVRALHRRRGPAPSTTRGLS